MKRPAEETLVAERPPPPQPANPFAGISLTSTAQSGGLFSAAAAGFAKPFEPSDQAKIAPAKSSSNPFMGLSLYSSSSSSAGLFTSAANSLPSGGSITGSTNFSASSSAAPANSSTPAAEAAAKSNSGAREVEEADDGENGSSSFAQGGGECTGEEGEEVIFRAECKLWKLVRQGDEATAPAALTGSTGAAESADTSVTAAASATSTSPGEWKWQERGCGIVRVNRNTKDASSPARLVMRMKGVLKVLLNTPIFPTASYEKIGQKSVKFVGIDEERAGSADVAFCAYRLNLQNTEQQSQFLNAVQKVIAAPAPKSSA
mmetsp:Transcript_12183/g.22453  ORF Transcript_12183/g.22453 Transcript_12183/m.22453 type:complete len:317 (-) Transcript_12183:28-978(-)